MLNIQVFVDILIFHPFFNAALRRLLKLQWTKMSLLIFTAVHEKVLLTVCALVARCASFAQAVKGERFESVQWQELITEKSDRWTRQNNILKNMRTHDNLVALMRTRSRQIDVYIFIYSCLNIVSYKLLQISVFQVL